MALLNHAECCLDRQPVPPVRMTDERQSLNRRRGPAQGLGNLWRNLVQIPVIGHRRGDHAGVSVAQHFAIPKRIRTIVP